MAALLVCAPGLTGSANAAPPTPPVPVGAEVGQVSATVACTMPVLGNRPAIIGLAGTLASQLGSGQQFYFSDGAGTLTIPASVVSAMIGLGAASVEGKVDSLKLNAANATPAFIDAAVGTNIVIPNVKLTAGQPVTVPLPAGALLKVGPYTAAASGIANISLGTTGATLQLRNAANSPILFPLKATCAAPAAKVTLAAVNIGLGAGLPPAEPAIGQRTPFGTVASGFVVGSIHIPLSCNVDSLGARTLTSNLIGKFPSVVGAGTAFSTTDGGGYLGFPAALVDEVLAKYPGAASASGALTEYRIDATNATPASINAAATPIAIPSTPLVAGQAASIAIPPTGTMNVGPYTAGAAGAITLSAGAGAGNITLADAGGAAIGTFNITCGTPSPAAVLTQITVT